MLDTTSRRPSAGAPAMQTMLSSIISSKINRGINQINDTRKAENRQWLIEKNVHYGQLMR